MTMVGPSRCRAWAWLVLLSGWAWAFSCGDGDKPTFPDDGQTAVKGFGLSPAGFPLDWSHLEEFYSEVSDLPGGGVLWNGAWRDSLASGADAGTIPAGAVSTVVGSRTWGFIPAIVFGWRSGEILHIGVPANPADDWANAEARNLFLSMLVDFATQHQPPYIFLGNENSFYYEQDPDDYARWIDFYDQAYEAIREASPGTAIGPVFNFEHLSGSGLLNGWTQSWWGALEAHRPDHIDVLGLTLYPWLSRAAPDSIPADYLHPLSSRIAATPLAITETGWPAENLGGLDPPWQTSEAAQVAYLDRLSAMLSGEDVVMVNWLFLHPMEDPGDSPRGWKLFGSVSVRDAAGQKRPIYDPWVSFCP
jgi:hypothetical protein